MKYLLDTHLLIWMCYQPERLSSPARNLRENESVDLYFSAVSVWEGAIKRALGRPDFQYDIREWRQELLDIGVGELVVISQHGVIAGELPMLHRDPFDRLLLGQAIVERLTLLTQDTQLLQYSAPTLRV